MLQRKMCRMFMMSSPLEAGRLFPRAAVSNRQNSVGVRCNAIGVILLHLRNKA
jgi:hypothetical protein